MYMFLVLVLIVQCLWHSADVGSYFPAAAFTMQKLDKGNLKRLERPPLK